MFTGIVQGIAQVISVKENADKTFRQIIIKLPHELTKNIEIGASIANNGCCLTVIALENDCVSFDVIEETLRLTNIKTLNVGDYVNIERAAKFGDEIGGHLMSGHITCTVEIKEIITTPDNCTMIFSLPDILRDYIQYKGFLGVDGASLTIGKVTKEHFYLHLIPETLNKTTLKYRKKGDLVNIELDPQTQTIVNTVKAYLQQQSA